MNGANVWIKLLRTKVDILNMISEGIDYYEISFNIVIQLVIKLFIITFNCTNFLADPVYSFIMKTELPFSGRGMTFANHILP